MSANNSHVTVESECDGEEGDVSEEGVGRVVDCDVSSSGSGTPTGGDVTRISTQRYVPQLYPTY